MSTHCLISRPIVAAVSAGVYPSLPTVGYLDNLALPHQFGQVVANADKSRYSSSRETGLIGCRCRRSASWRIRQASSTIRKAVAKVVLRFQLMLSTLLRYSFRLRFSSGNFSSRFIYHGVMSPSCRCDVFIIEFPS